MMRFTLVRLFLLAFPLAEIATFIVIGRYLGVLPVLALIFATSALGAVLLRFQGLAVLQRLRAETDAGRVPTGQLVHGAMIVLAGFLLLVPGFLTDILGLLLFVPFIRDTAWLVLRDRISFSLTRRSGPNGGDGRDFRPRDGHVPRDGQVIDLDESDYQSRPADRSPWRRPPEQ